ncbi:MAG: 30S ribosomal protein S24e [Candidatus Methanomethylicota archaeon]|nr:30S ribosomal protein S24e [Candidatus Culexmicrobium cathedralense]RLE49063.1 MAG: 30S ribosomal protein S24e [Candidatus Verstraetearchaeota archaeon]
MSGEEFQIEVVDKRQNPLLNRLELDIMIYHSSSGTPSRFEVRKAIAEQFKVPIDCICIRRLITEYGVGKTRGHVHVYESPERAKEIEPEYLIARDRPSEREEQAEAEG